MTEARQRLRSDDSRGALAALDALDTRYPSGVLEQEREVLRVEALLRSGATSAAESHARVFLRRWPESPYAGRVRELVER